MDPVIIVGAGISGLNCARILHRAGRRILVLEATDRIGGRVATDTVNGVRVDRGFQVEGGGCGRGDKQQGADRGPAKSK